MYIKSRIGRDRRQGTEMKNFDDDITNIFIDDKLEELEIQDKTGKSFIEVFLERYRRIKVGR